MFGLFQVYSYNCKDKIINKKVEEMMIQINLEGRETIRFAEFVDVAEGIKFGIKDLELSREVIEDIEDIFTTFDTKEVCKKNLI